MADGHREETAAQKQRNDVYSQRSNPTLEAVLGSRTATRDAAFFLPFLRPGMRVMDVGCGPGTITVGLAEVVAPARVDGFDEDGCPGRLLQPTCCTTRSRTNN